MGWRLPWVALGMVALCAACSLERSALSNAQAGADASDAAGNGARNLAGGAAGAMGSRTGDGSGGAQGSPMPADEMRDGAAGGGGAPAGGGPGAQDGSPGQPVDEPPAVEDFGLSCGGATCPAVAQPAEQCCTRPGDVQARRARAVDACGIERADVDGCMQLEQPGVIDDACPGLTPVGASAAEPGCCTDQGRCGTFDATRSIGCHENGAVDEPCGQELIDEDVSCEGLGIYAVKAAVDVTWGGRSGGLFEITDDGRGTIEVLIMARVEKLGAGNDFLGSMRPCATRLPPFYSSILCESYQPIFPDAIWDSPDAPEFDATGRFQCLNPGCIVTFDPVTAPVGIELLDADGAWPTADDAADFSCNSGAGAACFPDHDGDGNPGITVVLRDEGVAPGGGDCNEYDYRGAPLNANPFAILDGVVRTDRLHLGVRIRLGASGRMNGDCSGASGLGVADFVQSRAAGCMREPGTSNLFETPAGEQDPCRNGEALFMNQNLPIYDILGLGEQPRAVLDLNDRSPSAGPRYELIRLGDLDAEISCGDVRAAF